MSRVAHAFAILCCVVSVAAGETQLAISTLGDVGARTQRLTLEGGTFEVDNPRDVTPISRYRTSVQIARDGQHLRGTHSERSRTAGRIPIQVSLTTRFRGVPALAGTRQTERTKPVKRCGHELAACLTAKILDQ